MVSAVALVLYKGCLKKLGISLNSLDELRKLSLIVLNRFYF